MAKLLKNNKLVLIDDQYPIGTVLDFLQDNSINCMLFEYLSELVETMTGDSCTSFNTIGEMIKEIPEIVSCGEECAFLCVIDDDNTKWYILGWNHEDNAKLWNGILQTYFPDYTVVEE